MTNFDIVKERLKAEIDCMSAHQLVNMLDYLINAPFVYERCGVYSEHLGRFEKWLKEKYIDHVD